MDTTDSFRSVWRRKDTVTLGILVGGALCFRILFLGSRLVLSGDEVHYAESLFHFMKGNVLAGVSDYWSFFYPLAAVPFGFLARDAELGLRILSIVSGAALVVPGFAIARRLWGNAAAVFAGVFLAIHPNLISISTAAMTESLFALLLLSALHLYLGGMEGASLRSLGAAGFLLGLAYLTRPESLAFLVLLAAAAAAGWGGAGPASPRPARSPRVSRSIVMAALFVIAALPQFLLLHHATGRWTGGSKAAVNLSSPVIWHDDLAREEYVYSLNPDGTARRIDEVGRESVAKIAWREKRAIASRYPANLAAGFNLATLLYASPFLLLLVPLGIAGGALRRELRAATFLLLFFGLFPFFFYPVFRVELRYLVPYLPIHLLWAGAGVTALVSWFRDAVSPRRWARVILIVLIFASLPPYTINKYVVAKRGEPVEWKEIGRWIGETEGAGARILAKPGCSISYYAGAPMATFIPWTDVPGLLRFARAGKYGFLVVDEEYIRSARPGLRDLLQDPPLSDLTRVREFKSARGGSIVLYRVRPAS